jgi:hypothetical protein
MVYYSKVSYPLLGFIFLVFFGPLVPTLLSNDLTKPIVFTFCFLVVLFLFIVHMFFYTTYTIDDDELKIRCGFIGYKPYKIKDMKKVSKSTSIISSPAASFDRIQITYGKFDEIIISPKDKHQFVEDLQKINPELINSL